MMFWCLPPSGKCEWANLKIFAQQFNTAFGTQYRLSKCLDVSDRSKPQPEVLLENAGDMCMVIERKAIVWPPDYFKYHRSEHDFADYFTPLVAPLFQDGLYLLEINARDLRGNKAFLQSLARQVATSIRTWQSQVIHTGAIYSSRPVNWCFRRAQQYERDSGTPEKGVGVRFNQPMVWFDESIDAESAKARQAITVTLGDLLNRASLKFADYSDCLRVFLLEAYGDDWILTDDDIEQVIRDAVLPKNVDQIWLAKPKWISETDFEVAYYQVKANGVS